MKERIFVKSDTCFGCIIACRKRSEIKVGPYAGTSLEGPEFESTCLLGANCGVGDLETVAYASYLCDQYGMDTISTGATVGLAMELYERGILRKEDTSGIDLRFGNAEALIEVIKMIGERRGLGNLLAEGSRRVAHKVGRGSEYYVTHIKGLEAPAWDARAFWGHALSMAVSDRGACHLHSLVLGLEVAGLLERFSTEKKAYELKGSEDYEAACDTLIHCLFYTAFVPLLPKHAVSVLKAVTGMEVNEQKFLLVGERIINVTRLFNIREGLGSKDDILPERLMKEPHTSGTSKGKLLTKEMLEEMLKEYYGLRGWEEATGRPKEEKLRQLELY